MILDGKQILDLPVLGNRAKRASEKTPNARAGIEDQFIAIDSSYIDHPITGVTWYGSKAFADNYKRHQRSSLRTNRQWFENVDQWLIEKFILMTRLKHQII